MVDVFFFCVVFLLSHYFAVELPIICVFFLGKLFDENVKQLRWKIAIYSDVFL